MNPDTYDLDDNYRDFFLMDFLNLKKRDIQNMKEAEYGRAIDYCLWRFQITRSPESFGKPEKKGTLSWDQTEVSEV